MRLISRSHFLILVISEKTWVGFDEHGKYAGTDPYIADEGEEAPRHQQGTRYSREGILA